MARERCADLSRRFGATHRYGMSCGDGWTAWCIAEGGEVVRFYDAFEAEEKGVAGPGHPAESGYLLPHERVDAGDALDSFLDELSSAGNELDVEAFCTRYRQARRDLGIPDTCYATDIAARVSVAPGALGTLGTLGARTRITVPESSPSPRAAVSTATPPERSRCDGVTVSRSRRADRRPPPAGSG